MKRSKQRTLFGILLS